jgi:hypothetical protein
MKIKTQFVNPPIPFRCLDWIAWIDGEEDGLVGQGDTEKKAVEALKEAIEEDYASDLDTTYRDEITGEQMP